MLIKYQCRCEDILTKVNVHTPQTHVAPTTTVSLPKKVVSLPWFKSSMLDYCGCTLCTLSFMFICFLSIAYIFPVPRMEWFSQHNFHPPRLNPGGWSSHGQPVDQVHGAYRARLRRRDFRNIFQGDLRKRPRFLVGFRKHFHCFIPTNGFKMEPPRNIAP